MPRDFWGSAVICRCKANYIRAYFANFSLALVIPMFYHLGFSIQATDSYLNDPPPGFNPNTLITNVGLAYTLP